MARLTLTIVVDEVPGNEASASIDMEIFEKCRDARDVRTVVGNVFLSLLEALVKHDSDEPLATIIYQPLL